MTATPKLALLGTLLLVGTAHAAGVPLTLSTSGYLLDSADKPLSQPGISLRFSVWKDSLSSDEGNRVWPATGESECVVNVENGFYTAVFDGSLPSGCGAGLTSEFLPPHLPRYLQLSVEGTTLTPRMRIGTVPNAAFAAQSGDTQTLITALAASGAINAESNPVDWSQLKTVPPGFADGTDADTTYTAGSGGGLSLVGNAFSITAGGVTNAMLAGGAVGTAQIADGAITLAKLAALDGKVTGLDADLLDGLDSSAFAPATIEVKIDALQATATSTEGKVTTIKADVGTLATNVGSLSDSVGGVKSDVAGVATSIATVGTGVTGVNTRLGAPAGASVSADVAALTAAVASLTATVATLSRPQCPRHGETASMLDFSNCYGQSGLLATWFVKVTNGVPDTSTMHASYSTKVNGQSWDGVCAAFFPGTVARRFGAGSYQPDFSAYTAAAVAQYPVTGVFVLRSTDSLSLPQTGTFIASTCATYAQLGWGSTSQCGTTFANALGLAGYTGIATFALPCTRSPGP